MVNILGSPLFALNWDLLAFPSKTIVTEAPLTPPSAIKFRTYQVIDSFEVSIRERKPGLGFREVTGLQEVIHQRLHIIINFRPVGA